MKWNKNNTNDEYNSIVFNILVNIFTQHKKSRFILNGNSLDSMIERRKKFVRDNI